MRRRKKCIAPVHMPSHSCGSSDLPVRSVVYLGNMRMCAAHSPRLVGSRSRRLCKTQETRALHCLSAVSSHSSEQ